MQTIEDYINEFKEIVGIIFAGKLIPIKKPENDNDKIKAIQALFVAINELDIKRLEKKDIIDRVSKYVAWYRLHPKDKEFLVNESHKHIAIKPELFPFIEKFYIPKNKEEVEIMQRFFNPKIEIKTIKLSASEDAFIQQLIGNKPEPKPEPVMIERATEETKNIEDVIRNFKLDILHLKNESERIQKKISEKQLFLDAIEKRKEVKNSELYTALENNDDKKFWKLQIIKKLNGDSYIEIKTFKKYFFTTHQLCIIETQMMQRFKKDKIDIRITQFY
jgi:hypothetical protein